MTVTTLSIADQLLEIKKQSVQSKKYLRNNEKVKIENTGYAKDVIRNRVAQMIADIQANIQKVVDGKKHFEVTNDMIKVCNSRDTEYQHALFYDGESASIFNVLNIISKEYNVDLSDSIESLEKILSDMNIFDIIIDSCIPSESFYFPYNNFLIKL